MNILIENIGTQEQDNYLLEFKKDSAIWFIEKKFNNILKEIFSDYNLVENFNFFKNKQIIIDNKKYRPDYRLILTDDIKIIIEFQGYQHYTKCDTVYKDKLRKKMFENEGYIFLEFPYFIQPSIEVLEWFFKNIKLNIKLSDYSNNFPHGFIHPYSLSPGDFCHYGLLKYKNFLNTLPINIKNDINDSLKFKASNTNLPNKYLNP